MLQAFPAPGPWARSAACRGKDTAMFFPEHEADAKPAKALCRDCPVVLPCREYGFSHGAIQGVWGGLSDRDRNRYRKRVWRAKQAPYAS